MKKIITGFLLLVVMLVLGVSFQLIINIVGWGLEIKNVFFAIVMPIISFLISVAGSAKIQKLFAEGLAEIE